MKLGIIGLNTSISSTIMDTLRRSTKHEFVGVSDTDSLHQSKLQPYYLNATSLIDEVDAIIVLGQTVQKSEIIRYAAKHSKHILCEPPFARSLEESYNLLQYCVSNGVVLQSFFPLRHMPPVKHLKSLLTRNALGKLLAIKAVVRNPKPSVFNNNEFELSILLDDAIHTIDLLRWLVGEDFETVYMECDKHFSDSEGDDCASIVFNFTDGVLGTIIPSWSKPQILSEIGDIKLELIGSEGINILNVFGQQVSVVSERRRDMRKVFWGDVDFDEIINEFESTILKGTRNLLEVGMYSMEFCMAAYRSARDGEPLKLEMH